MDGFLYQDVFYSKYAYCQTPISVITKILSENDPLKFENISKEFEALGFTRVEHLAKITIEKARSIKLSGVSSKLLYEALEMFDKQLDDLQTSAKLENKNGNFIKAQQICKELLDQKPLDVNILNVMAESLFKLGDYDGSIRRLELALFLKPNSIMTMINMALNYLKQSKYDLAKHFLFESIRKSPRFNNAWIYYAELLVQTNDVGTAEYVFINILKVYPDSYIIRNKYGKLLLRQKKIKNAKQQFKIARRSGENCETLINLGDVYFMTDKLEKAIFNYQKALKINPNMNITWCNLGNIYAKINEHQKAIEAFEKSIKLDPMNSTALRYLAVSYCIQKEMVKSVETYKKCLKLRPDDLDINFELAMIYYHNLENLHEAENYFEKCIQLDPQRDDIYKYLMHVYKDLNKLIDASNICMTLGDIYLKKSDLENAKNAFYTALYLTPENADGHWKLGFTMQKLGHFDLALIRYRKADELKRNFAAHP